MTRGGITLGELTIDEHRRGQRSRHTLRTVVGRVLLTEDRQVVDGRRDLRLAIRTRTDMYHVVRTSRRDCGGNRRVARVRARRIRRRGVLQRYSATLDPDRSARGRRTACNEVTNDHGALSTLSRLGADRTVPGGWPTIAEWRTPTATTVVDDVVFAATAATELGTAGRLDRRSGITRVGVAARSAATRATEGEGVLTAVELVGASATTAATEGARVAREQRG
uniref:Unannotated protein n=1 Tax=freshwater metagenome TaxID=449393 RepID=A0A6J7P4Z8_9ZZZZ